MFSKVYKRGFALYHMSNKMGGDLMKRKLMFPLIVLFFFIASASAMRVDEGSGTSPLTLASSTIATVKFASDSFMIPYNTTIDLPIYLFDVQKCTGWQVYIYYDKTVVTCLGATQGSFLKQYGNTFFLVMLKQNYNATHGCIGIACVLLGMTVSVNGTGVLCSVKFQTSMLGSTLLHFANIKLADEKFPSQPIPVVAVDSSLFVV